MTTFEVATLADAVMKAARIAPRPSAPNAEKCMGILLDLQSAAAHVIATDLSVSYHQRVTYVKAPDGDEQYRVPAELLSGFLGSLPMGVGQEIDLYAEDGYLALRLSSGMQHAKLRLLPARDFPIVPWIASDEGFVIADRLAERVKQVGWAAHKHDDPLTGIHFDGHYIAATDRNRLATVPFEFELEEPITAPIRPLTGLLRNLDEVQMRATKNRLEFLIDEDTQVTAGLFSSNFPSLNAFTGKWTDLLKWKIVFERNDLADVLRRMIVLAAEATQDALAGMNVSFLEDHMELDMRLDVGEIHERMACSGDNDGPVRCRFSPLLLHALITNGARESMTISLSGDSLKPVRFSDSSGFKGWITEMQK